MSAAGSSAQMRASKRAHRDYRKGFKKREAELARRIVDAIHAMQKSMLTTARQIDLIESAARLREDDDGHWVTINGTHVHIGADGAADKGPATIVDAPAAPPKVTDGAIADEKRSFAEEWTDTSSGLTATFAQVALNELHGRELDAGMSAHSEGYVDMWRKTLASKDAAVVRAFVAQQEKAYAGRPFPLTEVYRGVRRNDGMALEKAQVGDQIRMRPLVSTTADESMAMGFTGVQVNPMTGNPIPGTHSGLIVMRGISGDNVFMSKTYGDHVGMSNEAETIVKGNDVAWTIKQIDRSEIPPRYYVEPASLHEADASARPRLVFHILSDMDFGRPDDDNGDPVVKIEQLRAREAGLPRGGWRDDPATGKDDVVAVPVAFLRTIHGNGVTKRKGSSGSSTADQVEWIAKDGVKSPLTITIDRNLGRMCLSDGNHRAAALDELGYEYAPVRIRYGDIPSEMTQTYPIAPIPREAIAREGWVTINGTHVFIGDGGAITKGPSDLIGLKPGTETPEHGHYLVSGRVQGVQFRANAIDVARALGVDAHVRNMPSSQVEVDASGPKAALKTFEAYLHVGNPGSEVSSVKRLSGEMKSLSELDDGQIVGARSFASKSAFDEAHGLVHTSGEEGNPISATAYYEKAVSLPTSFLAGLPNRYEKGTYAQWDEHYPSADTGHEGRIHTIAGELRSVHNGDMVTLQVTPGGKPTISEGGHILRAAQTNGDARVPTVVQFFGGGEKKWSPYDHVREGLRPPVGFDWVLREDQHNDPNMVADTIDAATFAYELHDAMMDEFKIGFEEAAAELDIDMSFDALPQDALDAMEAYIDKFAASVAAGERQGVLDMLRAALADGVGAQELGRRLADYFDEGVHRIAADGTIKAVEDIAAWANSVARTELSRAYNTGRTNLYRDVGYDLIMWDTSHDDRVCDSCDQNDGVVVRMGEPFPSGSDCPPEHPNCLCVVIADPDAIKAHQDLVGDDLDSGDAVDFTNDQDVVDEEGDA